MTKGCAEVVPLVVDFLKDAACFFACSSASFKDKAMAALRSGSSSSSALRACPFGLGFDDSLFSCDWGTKPVFVMPFASSKLISSALLRSSSKLLSILALRGCIGVGLVAKETRRSVGLTSDFFVSFS